MLASIKKMIRKRSQIYITYFNEGLAEFLNGNSERAILLFDEGLEIENSYFPLWHAKGVVLLCERRYEDAIICFRAAINLKSLSLTALMGLGIAHAKLQQITEAAEYYRQIQIRAPRVENITNNLYCRKYVIHATLERFWLTLEQNHLSTVLNFCNQTLAIPTEQVNISINGYTRHYSSNFFESVKIKAKIFKGYILLLQGQWQEALQQFEESPERLPLGDLTSNYFDGDTHWWAPEELFSFQSFNELGERETYLAFAKKGLGRLDEARIHFQNALMSNPLAMRAKIGLGSLLLLQNNWIEARNYFNDMLAANNNSINALNYKAFALLNNNEINEARDCFERAYQLNNQSAMAVFGRSLIANANQNLEEANRNYEQAVTILNARPEYIAEQLEYYWLYGKSCITLRMFDRARTVFERMLQLKPNYVHAQRAMTELGEVQLNHQQQQTPVNDHAEIQILARSLEQSINNNEALATANTQLEVRVTQLEERIAQLNQEITILEESLKVALDNSEKAEQFDQDDLDKKKQVIDQLMAEIERLNLFKNDKFLEKDHNSLLQENRELKLINSQKDDEILRLKRRIQELETKIDNLPKQKNNLSTNPASQWNKKVIKNADVPSTSKDDKLHLKDFTQK